MSVIPAMALNWRSSGVANELATVSGSAPGRLAVTAMVGNSTCGSEATGSMRKASRPSSMMPTAIRVVATGRRTNGPDRSIAMA